MTATFSVKNFSKFQHYKDRSPPWIRLYNSLLDDYDFGLLPDASKAHLLAIWLLASRYDNKIPYDAGWVSKRINATEPVDLGALASAGFIVLDQACSNSLAERKQDANPETEESRAEDYISAPVRGNDPQCRLEFSNVFWPEYPHRVGHPKAMEAFIRARAKASLDDIMGGVRRYAAAKPDDVNWLNPATFLDDERWKDEPATAPTKPDSPHDAIFRALAERAQAGRGGDERPTGPDVRLVDLRRAEEDDRGMGSGIPPPALAGTG